MRPEPTTAMPSSLRFIFPIDPAPGERSDAIEAFARRHVGATAEREQKRCDSRQEKVFHEDFPLLRRQLIVPGDRAGIFIAPDTASWKLGTSSMRSSPSAR